MNDSLYLLKLYFDIMKNGRINGFCVCVCVNGLEKGVIKCPSIVCYF